MFPNVVMGDLCSLGICLFGSRFAGRFSGKQPPTRTANLQQQLPISSQQKQNLAISSHNQAASFRQPEIGSDDAKAKHETNPAMTFVFLFRGNIQIKVSMCKSTMVVALENVLKHYDLRIRSYNRKRTTPQREPGCPHPDATSISPSPFRLIADVQMTL